MLNPNKYFQVLKNSPKINFVSYKKPPMLAVSCPHSTHLSLSLFLQLLIMLEVEMLPHLFSHIAFSKALDPLILLLSAPYYAQVSQCPQMFPFSCLPYNSRFMEKPT